MATESTCRELNRIGESTSGFKWSTNQFIYMWARTKVKFAMENTRNSASAENLDSTMICQPVSFAPATMKGGLTG